MLILAFDPRLGLPSSLFPSGITTATLHAFLLSPHNCYTPRPYLSSWFDGGSNVCEQYTLCSSSQSSTFPCYLVPLRPKYLPQHLFSSTTSLCSSCGERDQVSHPYKRQNYHFVYFNFHIFGWQTRKKWSGKSLEILMGGTQVSI
jgi:hypothetical protein